MKSLIQNILAVFVLSMSISSIGYAGTPEAFSLKALEESARHQIQEKRPDIALEIYHQYEKKMIEEGWTALNEDLLMNQAIAAYQAGVLGESLAYLKQLEMIRDDALTHQMETEIQTLIEHEIFKKYPNHAFIRGDSDSFVEWENTHKFTQTEARITMLSLLSLFLLMVCGIVIFRKRSRILTAFFVCLSIVMLLCLTESVIFLDHQKESDSSVFAVVLDDFEMHTEPDKSSAHLPKNAFIPGMTVQIINALPGWVKVMRMDGETGWMESHACYVLRGVGAQTSWHVEHLNLYRHEQPQP